MCYFELLELSKGLLTPLIAVVTIIIAYLQWRTNEQKLKLDCYDRRSKVYESAKHIICISMNDETTIKDIIEFNRSIADADFLLEPEIITYLNEVSKHCNNLRRYNREYPEHEAIDGMEVESMWLNEQLAILKNKFMKHLKIKTSFWC